MRDIENIIPRFFVFNNCVVHIQHDTMSVENTECCTCGSKYFNIYFDGYVDEWLMKNKTKDKVSDMRWTIDKYPIDSACIRGNWLHDCTNEKGIKDFDGMIWCNRATNRQFIQFCNDVFNTKILDDIRNVLRYGIL